MGDLEKARTEKVTEEHGVIDDAIADRGEGYTVFSIVRAHTPAPFLVLSSITARWNSLQTFGE